MRILYFHGWGGRPSGTFATFLGENGYDVVDPHLPSLEGVEGFQVAVKVGQEAFDQCQPDLIVGFSRGGGVAINIDSGSVPLVLIAPDWRFKEGRETVKRKALILHSPEDLTINWYASKMLLANSELPEKGHLIEVRGGHSQMKEPPALEALLDAIKQVLMID